MSDIMLYDGVKSYILTLISIMTIIFLMVNVKRGWGFTCRPPSWAVRFGPPVFFGLFAACIFIAFVTQISTLGGILLVFVHIVLYGTMFKAKLRSMGYTFKEFEQEVHKYCNHD